MVASRAKAFAKRMLTRHLVGRVGFEGVSAEPVSRIFGIDRGTPIDRVLIENFLSSQREFIRGDCLEVEEPTYTRKFGAAGHVSHVLKFAPSDRPGHGAEVVADLTRPDTVPAGRFDCFICTQTLNFIFDLAPVIVSIHRLLKPGGRALITAAGISQISRFDYERWGDYWRFTDQSLAKLLTRQFSADKVRVSTVGNVALSCLFLQGLAAEDVPDPSLLQRTDPDYPMLVCAVAEK